MKTIVWFYALNVMVKYIGKNGDKMPIENKNEVYYICDRCYERVLHKKNKKIEEDIWYWNILDENLNDDLEAIVLCPKCNKELKENIKRFMKVENK